MKTSQGVSTFCHPCERLRERTQEIYQHRFPHITRVVPVRIAATTYPNSPLTTPRSENNNIRFSHWNEITKPNEHVVNNGQAESKSALQTYHNHSSHESRQSTYHHPTVGVPD